MATAAQHLARFNAWMAEEYPDFDYSKAQAERLLRDYRAGRVTIPRDLEARLEGHAPPAPAPAPTSRRRRAPPAPPPPPAVFPGKQLAPSRHRRSKTAPPPPPVTRIEATRAPHPSPARPSHHAPVEVVDEDTGDVYREIDEDEIEDAEGYVEVETSPVDYVPFLDDWADYGNLEIETEDTES